MEEQTERTKETELSAKAKKRKSDKTEKEALMTGIIIGMGISLLVATLVLCVKILKADNTNTVVSETVSDGDVSEGRYASVIDGAGVTDKIAMIDTIIDNYYIEDIDNKEIEEGIYDGMMDSLKDPYADYYTAEELMELTSDTEGIYDGIGAYLMKSTENAYPVITGVIKGSPAEKAGLKIDDYITKVNGEDIIDMELTEVVSHIKGKEGTKVDITVMRLSTKEELVLSMVRSTIETPTVEYENKGDGVAYISISQFTTVTVSQFEKAMSDARKDGMKGLILDLRGNPGGSLVSVIDISEQLLPKGLIVFTEDKYGKREEYTSSGKNEIDVPVVVLIDGGSASAAEILSGAIKDYGIGTLIGTTTYGKGIVQRVIPMRDGSAVKLTVSHYYTPLGNDIHKVGVEPDETVEFDADKYMEDQTDNQLERALEVIKEKIGQ